MIGRLFGNGGRNDDTVDPLSAHLEPHLGKPDGVIHKVLSADTDVPVLPFPPTHKHPWMFVTNGLRHRGPALEVMIAVHDTRRPDTDRPSFYRQPPFSDAVTLLNKLSDHAQSEQMVSEMTIIMDGPIYPDTGLDSVLVFPPVLLPAEATQPELEGKPVDLLCLYPIYRQERDFAASAGTRALLPLLFSGPVTTRLFDPQRPAIEEGVLQ